MKFLQTLDLIQPILNYNSIKLVYFHGNSKIDYNVDKFNINHYNCLYHYCAITENSIIKIGNRNSTSTLTGTIFVTMHFYKKRSNICMFKYDPINNFLTEFYISDPKSLKHAHSVLKILDRLSYTSIYKNALYKNCIEYDLLIKRLVNLY